jgi:selenocysteine-specific elongation factor
LLLGNAVRDDSLEEIIYHLIADQGQPVAAEKLKRHAGYIRNETIDRVLDRLTEEGRTILLGSLYWTKRQLIDLTEQFTAVLIKYHKEKPERAGLSKEIIRQKLRLTEKVCELLLERWQKEGWVVLSGAEVGLKQFADQHSDWRQDLLLKADAILTNNGLTTVDVSLLVEKLGIPLDKARATLEILIKEGQLIKVGEMHVYRKTIQNIAKVIQRHFQTNPTLTVAELRDLIGTSRKVALPLLEYYDMHKYTVREGDVRRLGPKIQDLSE